MSSCCNKLKGKLLQSAGGNTNGGTYNNTDISKTGVSSIGNYCRYWDGLKGDVPKLAPAELKIYRNIGVWRHRREVRLLVHAPSEKLECTNQHGLSHTKRWGQCSLRYPPTAERPMKPWRQIQGGVVEPEALFGGHGPWRSGIADVSELSRVAYKCQIIVKTNCMYCD